MTTHKYIKTPSLSGKSKELLASSVSAKVVTALRADKAFRINSKYYYLTYPKCSLAPEFVLELLKKNFAYNPIHSYLIVKEKHEDGSPHIHAWIRLTQQRDTRNPERLYLSFFEPNAKEPTLFKGNFQNMRKPSAVLEYLQKEIKFRARKLTQEEMDTFCCTNLHLDSLGYLTDCFAQAIRLAEENKLEDALDLLQDNSPQTFLTNYTRWHTALKSFLPKNRATPQFPKDCFNIPKSLIKWLEQDSSYFSLYLSGPPNAGKTQCLLTLFEEAQLEPAIIRHTEDLKNVDFRTCKALIFDDISYAGAPHTQKINVLDVMQDSSIRVLYQTVNIPKGIIKAFTSNDEFLDHFFKENKYEEPYTQCKKDALLRRVRIIHMFDPLFKNPKSVCKYPDPPIFIKETQEVPDIKYVNKKKKTATDLHTAGIDPEDWMKSFNALTLEFQAAKDRNIAAKRTETQKPEETEDQKKKNNQEQQLQSPPPQEPIPQETPHAPPHYPQHEPTHDAPKTVSDLPLDDVTEEEIAEFRYRQTLDDKEGD